MHEHDDQGRLVASRAEVEWDDDERGWMLALADYEASLCPGCGDQLAETSSPEAAGAYDIQPPVRCHRCSAIAIARKAIADQYPQPEALYPIVRKRGE